MKLMTRVQVLDCAAFEPVDGWELSAVTGTLTINSDLLEYCLQEIQASVSSANSDSLVAVSIDSIDGLGISVTENSSGFACQVRVPARSIKLEGQGSRLTFKAWTMLCMQRFISNTGGSTLFKIELFRFGLRLIVRLADSGDSKSELRLLSAC
jgi:hypothetical protein